MAAYRLVYDSCHLQADCQEPVSALEPYTRQSNMGNLYLFYCDHPTLHWLTTNLPCTCSDLPVLMAWRRCCQCTVGLCVWSPGVPGTDVQVAAGHPQPQPVHRWTEADSAGRCRVRSRRQCHGTQQPLEQADPWSRRARGDCLIAVDLLYQIPVQL